MHECTTEGFGFRLDLASGMPAYAQLVQQVRHAVRLGLLGPGDQLPTVREVVERLVISPNTVLKAYRELEHAGLIVTRPGAGTFVLARSTQGAPPPSVPPALVHALRVWLVDARAAGLDEATLDALIAYVRRAERPAEDVA
jgi:GntR family transcriptional regulator